MSQFDIAEPNVLKVSRRRSVNRAMQFDHAVPADLLESLWAAPDRLVALGEPLQVKERGVVVRCKHAQGEFLLKRQIWGGASRTLRSLHRKSTARRCADIGWRLVKEGIPTPRPRAFLEHGPGPLSYRSYLLTDFVPGASLFHCLRYNRIEPHEMPALAEQVAEIWQRLIDLKISHNDLKPENFIVDENRRVWLIDVEKAKLKQDEAKLRRRHLEDARIFLHVRNWRDQRNAADVFRQALLRTTLGNWAEETAEQRSTLCHGYEASELASRFSVVVVVQAGGEADRAATLSTAASVRDMADEVVVVEPATRGGKFVPVDAAALNISAAERGRLPVIAHETPQYPWVLVLRAGERATPDLVRELCELVVDQPVGDAVRIPLETIQFGRPVHAGGGKQIAPIRAFHQERCAFSLEDGELHLAEEGLNVLAMPRKIEQVIGGSLHEFIEQLNRQSTEAAQARLAQGGLPRSGWGLPRAGGRFCREYLLGRGFRDGWLGVQLALLRAHSQWMEEAKLGQQMQGFRRLAEKAGTDGEAVTHEPAPIKADQEPASRAA